MGPFDTLPMDGACGGSPEIFIDPAAKAVFADMEPPLLTPMIFDEWPNKLLCVEFSMASCSLSNSSSSGKLSGEIGTEYGPLNPPGVKTTPRDLPASSTLPEEKL